MSGSGSSAPNRSAPGPAPRVLVLDNYDSFAYNLVQYLGELGAEVRTVRNDRATVDELLADSYERCVVSPGPCTPEKAGISLELVRRMPEAGVPTLGVCLGQQLLFETSEEGDAVMLGRIPGEVKRIEPAPARPVPKIEAAPVRRRPSPATFLA